MSRFVYRDCLQRVSLSESGKSFCISRMKSLYKIITTHVEVSDLGLRQKLCLVLLPCKLLESYGSSWVRA